jgi:DNA (cytosine-5)-methyltransferase 1
VVAFGGGQNCAQTDVSTALSAHPGGSRLDFQTETFVTHSLRGEGFDAIEDGTGRGTPLVPVAFQPRIARNGRGNMGDVVNALQAQSGQTGKGDAAPCVATAMQVRRLTPTECERLQGFPDNYTAIPWRGKPASECPDGPRYKALGNSWAVPVVRWIGRRIHDAVQGTNPD